MKHYLLAALLLICSTIAYAEPAESFVYKGTVGNRPVTLYLGKGEGCGGDEYYYSGMYCYDGISKWLFISITYNSKGGFCMVEDKLTGLLLLTRKGNTLQGKWLSPDGTKSLPVLLTEQKPTTEYKNELYNKWDKLNYELHDC